MLCEELVADPDATRKVVAMQHNMRGIRRLVATGVTDRGPVAEALRPFLPLSSPLPGGLANVFLALADQLAVNGIEPEKATNYVTVFTETGTLDDA